MINLNNYIILKESKQETTANSDRLEKLKKWLSNKKYSKYVETLQKMLDDPKAKTLLEDGFGGDLGDIDFDFEVKLLTAKSLIPTQKEIDVDKSIKHVLTKVNNIKPDFDETKDGIVVNDMPLVTFRGNYVIDGHHRWSEIVMINPDGKMLCYDYDAPTISPIQMLKAVQGSIAAVLSKDDNAEMPKNDTKGTNIYSEKWNAKKISEYIKKTMTDDVYEELKNYYPKINSKNELIKILTDNILSMKVNNVPIEHAPDRKIMPQPDKAGTDRDNEKTSKETASPDDEGSALNRIKNGKFIDDVL